MGDSKLPSAEDAIHVDGEAYDVAKWAKRHPGGDLLLRLFRGRDATAVFAAFHGEYARKVLRGLRAKVQPEVPAPQESESAFERAMGELREEAVRDGLFVASRPWFAMKAAIILGLIGVAFAVALVWPAGWVVGALALAVAWQQAGWFAHDVLHHSVLEDKGRGEAAGLVFGGVVLGFSPHWWKQKHNTHHALPNVLGVDEDIDTMPLLAFDERELTRAGSLSRFMVGLQVITALPILAFARLNWCVQSVLWALRAPGVPRRLWEVASLGCHLAWSIGLLAILPGWGVRIGFFLVSQLVSGLMTGAVFLVGHNARPIYARAEAPGFHELQCTATQNVRAMFGTAWFFGGLDRQIEHHLFPTMPRHQHRRVTARVRALCAIHNVPYVERGFFSGLADVWGVLARVGRAARRNVVATELSAAPVESRIETGVEPAPMNGLESP